MRNVLDKASLAATLAVMRGARPLAALAASAATILAGASGETTHTYAVTLTISVDRAAGKLNGTIVTDAPSEFCDSSTVRVRTISPGNDRVIARVRPVYGEWHLRSFPALRGKRVYAEVLAYHLPERPVECLGARSRTVTAP
jgi:hypothetical protein